MPASLAAASQLPLFEDNSAPNPVTTRGMEAITWSHAKRSTLERCPLQYYFEYFGSNSRTAKPESRKEELRLLKSLSNRYERTGSILHTVISWYLREAQRGKTPDLSRMVRWAGNLFQSDRRYSERNPDRIGPQADSAFSPALLREYRYRQTDAEELCDKAEARLLEAVRAFATDPRYDALRALGSLPGALIEHSFKSRLAQLPCRVTGKVDLAFDGVSAATIVDWKLGSGDSSGDNSLQLAVYALWAADTFGRDPSSLRVCKVHLGSREVVDFHVDKGVLEETRARVIQDAVRMAAMEKYGASATAEAFTPCAVPAVCNQCHFQRICPSGRKFINA